MELSPVRPPRARALWAEPDETEVGAPERRIIHAYHAGFGSHRDVRVGVRPALGYLKCGSRIETDWVRDVRVYLFRHGGVEPGPVFRELPSSEGITWLGVMRDIEGILVEVRRSWIDGWWPGWNLAEGGVLLEAVDGSSLTEPAGSHAGSALHVVRANVDRVPSGVTATLTPATVTYRSESLEIAFSLRAPSLLRFAFDADSLDADPRDLLKHASLFDHTGSELINNVHHPFRSYLQQGPRFVDARGREPIGYLAHGYSGQVDVEGNRVRYTIDVPGALQRYELAWRIEPDGVSLEACRQGDAEVLAAESSAWHFAFDSRVTPVGVLGEPIRRGEAGLAEAPLLVHAPRFGTLGLASHGAAVFRFDSVRPFHVTTLEFKVGEVVGTHGLYRLPPGRHYAQVDLTIDRRSSVRLRPETPSLVSRAIANTATTAVTYRLDTATLSNNANSIHAPLSAEHWSVITQAIGPMGGGLNALMFLRDSLDRHLDGAPGYGAGRTSHGPGRLEDDYLMTDVAVVVAIANYVADSGDRAWLDRRWTAIEGQLSRLRARDVDGDGLVESTTRQGIAGTAAWSTNWWDVISFGWKDAWVNALLYGGLCRLRDVLAGDSRIDRIGLNEWAVRLKDSYLPAFWNPVTGWFAGWRSADDVLHDYAFLFVNGAAVTAGLIDVAAGRVLMERLWKELGESGFGDFGLGLPGNLRPIPDIDTPGVFGGLPFGFYQNGGATLSQARHFIEGLFHVGMDEEAERVLLGALTGLAEGTAFGGCGSGLDWRFWDGSPCGYEGILTEQLGVLAPAIARYGEHPS